MTETMSQSGGVGAKAFPGLSPHRGVRDDIQAGKYRDVRQPRKICLYYNGDRYFKGKKVYLTPHRYSTFNDMLSDLTQKLPSSVNLPYGVRQIFMPDGTRIRHMNELKGGGTYVVAGFENFKHIKYGSEVLEPWSHGKCSCPILMSFSI